MTSRRQFDVKDEECLEWIRDPSVSPFTNKKVIKKYILNNENLLNNIKRRCFYNSALRQQIVKQITEYKQNGTLRLYTSDMRFEYSTPPFTRKECEAWAKDHFINPRTGLSIRNGGSVFLVYLDLLYTTLQYGLPTPPILNNEPEEKETRNLFKYINEIIINVKERLAFIDEIDNLFLHQPIGTIPIGIGLPKTPKAKNTFDVSSFDASSSPSNKNLSPAKKRRLQDMMLEENEKEKSVAEYKQSKRSQKQLTKHTLNKNLFPSIRTFFSTLSSEVEEENGTFIAKIVESYTPADIKAITDAIQKYFDNNKVSDKDKNDYFYGDMDITNIIRHYIRNIYSQLLNPSNKTASRIEYLSYANHKDYFKRTMLSVNISLYLLKYIEDYTPRLDKRIKKYLADVIDDVIEERDSAKLPMDRDNRDTAYNTSFDNNYYRLLYLRDISPMKPDEMRLPKGMGFETIVKSGFSIDEYPENNFTYDECRDWVLMPIFNPRTFKPILIDSPIYNRLLCMSYQYDTKLIPRMITTKGKELLIALFDTIKAKLKETGNPPQSRKELEEYIRKTSKFDAKFKIIGTKQPSKGTEIINKKMRNAFIESAGLNGQLPFYVFLEDLREFGITAEAANDAYIKIEDIKGIPYYYAIVKERERREIINTPIVTVKRTDYWKFKNIYSIEECFEWINEPEIDPRTERKIYQDSLEYNSIFEQALLFNTNIEPYGISPDGIKFKKKILKSIPDYYDIGDCLRWIRRPEINPKTGDPILPDSEEYNAIFNKALLYDSYMRPANITATGMKYRRAILKNKRQFFGAEKSSKRPTGKGKDIKEIHSDVCDAIQRIYGGSSDDGGDGSGSGYRYFKDRMIGRCQQYHKPPEVCLNVMKTYLKEQYPQIEYSEKQYFSFFKDSAIASVIVYFYIIKDQVYNTDQDIFTNNYTKLDVFILEIADDLSIQRSVAIDAGGPVREFLTTFYEELFCDNEHPKRPFIQPRDNKEGKYYINPNFEPDGNFRKVIAVYEKWNGKMAQQFNTEKDYRHIYYIIGKVLSIAVVNEDIGLPKELSTYIVAGLIKQPKDITLYDLLYFYVCEFGNTLIYINMISDSQIDGIDYVGLAYNDNYVISKTGHEISKENCIKFLLQLAKHIITKNFLNKSEPRSNKSMKSRYDSLFSGFDNKLRIFLAEKKVSVEQLNQLITNEGVDKKMCKELASKIRISIEGKYDLNADEIEMKLKGMRRYITNIITNNKEKRDSDEDHNIFIRKLLRFWTALPNYNKNANYTIYYKYGKDTNGKAYDTKRIPESHTCFNQLEIFGFPSTIRSSRGRENYIYKKLKSAVDGTSGIDNP